VLVDTGQEGHAARAQAHSGDAAAEGGDRRDRDRAVAGHEQVETTQVYVHADLAIKEQALARTVPVNGEPGRYRPPDSLLAFLEAL
jgi:hypothetical protein